MTDRTAGRGLPDGAHKALAAALAPHLRNHPGRTARPGHPDSSDLAVWDTATRAEILDALWDAGLLTLPGSAPRPPLHREPVNLADTQDLVDQVARVLDPILRDAAMAAPGGSAWASGMDSRELAGEASFAVVVAALYQAGVMVLDQRHDRASQRAGWAALGEALTHLVRHEDVPANVLSRVAPEHVGYLLGQQGMHQQLREAWARIDAAATLLECVADADDVGYLRTNLAVLRGLLAGRIEWRLTEPRRGTPADVPDLCDEVRRRAGMVAVDAERLFAAVGDAILNRSTPQGRPLPDGTDAVLASQHLYAYRTAVYAWATAALLGFIRAHHGDVKADEAAAIFTNISERGFTPYMDDLPRPTDEPNDYAGLLDAWTAGKGTDAH